MDFYEPDLDKFVCLRLAREAAEQGGTAPTILNAGNEVAVAGFLAGQIGFLQIAQIIEHTLQQVPSVNADSLETVLAADSRAREVASCKLSG